MGRREHYTDCMFINNQNSKADGTNIMNIDTIRGCPFNCESCYSKRNSALTIINFEKPIKINKFTGKVHADRQYRIGNNGDPCVNWKHSEELVKRYDIDNNFIVTKLQNLRGFTGFFKNLQVSLDPLNEKHFSRTLSMLIQLEEHFPNTKIVIRLRTLVTSNGQINWLMRTAINFANRKDFPIMETRMRFQRKECFEKYQLDPEYYEWKGSYYRPVNGISFLDTPILEEVKKYYDCDLYGRKCRGCGNCTITWDEEQYHKEGKFIANESNSAHYIKEAA